MNNIFNSKEFIRAVLEMKPELSSKEISDFLKKKGHDISWQTVAGIKGSLKND